MLNCLRNMHYPQVPFNVKEIFLKYFFFGYLLYAKLIYEHLTIFKMYFFLTCAASGYMWKAKAKKVLLMLGKRCRGSFSWQKKLFYVF